MAKIQSGMLLLDDGRCETIELPTEGTLVGLQNRQCLKFVVGSWLGCIDLHQAGKSAPLP